MYKNTPYWDIWSFGVLVCSVCHDQSERAKVSKSWIVYLWSHKHVVLLYDCICLKIWSLLKFGDLVIIHR